MRRTLLRLVVSAVLFCGLGAVRAGTNTYTFDGTGSGDLGGVGFTNAAFTITVVAETMNIVNCSGGTFSLDSTTASIAISGFPTVSILTPTRVFDNNDNSDLGFSLATCNGPDLMDMSDPAFANYALYGDRGPIFNATPFPGNQFHNVQTSGGILNMADNSVRNVTFNANCDGGPDEPGLQAPAAPSSDVQLEGFVSGVLYNLFE